MFGIWPPPQTSTIHVSRPNYDSRGNRDPLKFDLEAVVVLQPAMNLPRLGDGQENRFIQGGSIFIQRDATGPAGNDGNPVPALQAGDAIIYNGENFTIVGRPRATQRHPMTGTDFGWAEFQLQGAG